MRAAKLKERPGFSLMKQTDIQNLYYMQMPRWLFSDPRYADMSLDAKVTYTFLLNRFQLSRRKGWVNDQGEVFVIFPRLALAKELRVCEKRVTAAFRVLAERHLIWEKRCGRGDANQIYLARVEPIDDPDYTAIPDLREQYHRGDALDCIVKEYDKESGKLVISVKETNPNPFDGAELRHPEGVRRQAEIAGKYAGGVFCNLPDGVVVMCSYSFHYDDAAFAIGDKVIVMIQRYDFTKKQIYGKIVAKW